MAKYTSVDFDSVAPLQPHDRVAGQVASNGEHFEFENTAPGYVTKSTPIKTRRETASERDHPDFTNYRGSKFGKLTVIGISDEYRKKRKDTGGNRKRWVVRCVCGNYEHRKTVYIKKALADMVSEQSQKAECAYCGYKRKIREGFAPGLPEKIDVVTLKQKSEAV